MLKEASRFQVSLELLLQADTHQGWRNHSVQETVQCPWDSEGTCQTWQLKYDAFTHFHEAQTLCTCLQIPSPKPRPSDKITTK